MMADAVFNAWTQGISVVASKGNNDGSSDLHIPSDFYTAIGVGSVREGDAKRSDFSNVGNDIRITATGEPTTSLVVGGGITSRSGTSFSAPQVTAVLSLIRAANLDLIADEAENIMYLTARDIGDAGYDDEHGFGIVDAGAAVNYAASRFFVRLGGSHTSLVAMPIQPFVLFDPVFGFGPIAGTAQNVLSWSARKYIDYSAYSFVEIPDILIRARSFKGWPLENSTVREVPTFRIVSQDLNGAMLETGIYWVNGSLWPCDNPPAKALLTLTYRSRSQGFPVWWRHCRLGERALTCCSTSKG